MKTYKQMLKDAESYADSLRKIEEGRRAVMALHGLDAAKAPMKRTGFYRAIRPDHSQVEIPGRLESWFR